MPWLDLIKIKLTLKLFLPKSLAIIYPVDNNSLLSLTFLVPMRAHTYIPEVWMGSSSRLNLSI